ncbi:hypothetical protein [Paraburkholderia hospita]|uniref:hypothetical protein n=1 Tax=Paraburkholderia TaxID=1822464 RepID=UPI0013FDA231|nr:hypothetical protein [Paraburkholderia hospita]
MNEQQNARLSDGVIRLHEVDFPMQTRDDLAMPGSASQTGRSRVMDRCLRRQRDLELAACSAVLREKTPFQICTLTAFLSGPIEHTAMRSPLRGRLLIQNQECFDGAGLGDTFA